MKRVLSLAAVALLSGVLGGLFGEILLKVLPSGMVHDFIGKGFRVGLPVSTLDLRALSLSLGFSFHVTPLFILGVLLGGFLYYKFS